MTAAPARESLSAQARPIPLAAPVTRALCPVRSTLTDEGPDVIEASFMSLLPPRRNILSQAGSFPDAPLGNQYTAPCRGLSPSTRRTTSPLRPLWNSAAPFTGPLPPR